MRIFEHSMKKIMKRIFYLLVIVLCAMSVSAQDMKTVFVNMPDTIVPLLTKVNREDCVDFLASNMNAQVKNRFDKQAELKTLTMDYLLMQMTDVSTLEMKLLPINDSTKVICMVKTLCSSVCDSEVFFYNTNWKELDASLYVQLPSADAFYLPVETGDEDYTLYRKKADVNLLKLSLATEGMVLSCEYVTPSWLDEEDRKKLECYLRKEPIVLQWINGRFQ